MLNDRQEIEGRLQQRNRKIGEHLAEARQSKQRSITECANILATSRRRYTAIERGDVPVSVAELEVLAEFLDLPLAKVLNGLEQSIPRPITVRVQSGEKVHVIFEIKGMKLD